jgi:hypothetical protein
MILTNSGTTFQVSKVECCTKTLPTISYQDSFRKLLFKNVDEQLQFDNNYQDEPFDTKLLNLSQKQHQVEAFSQGNKPLVDTNLLHAFFGVSSLHPFLAAVHIAFAQHYPLIISPDFVWLCLIQGLALHVNTNAEKLRHQFVGHEGKAKIIVDRNDLIKGSADNPWPEVFGEFSTQIKGYIGNKHELIVADFSTTGAVERAVSEIVLMDVLQQYFEFELQTMCGIPEITLEGTVDDWKSIRQRAEKFAEFDLEWWIKPLIPILDQFVKAASGDVERDFWQSFYKINDMSGGPFVTGWINALFPYIQDCQTKGYTLENHFVDSWSEAMNEEFGGGPSTDSFPVGLSKVPFVWKYYDLTFDMEFIGGFVGVTQDQQTLALRPEIGWAVLDVTQPNN